MKNIYVIAFCVVNMIITGCGMNEVRVGSTLDEVLMIKGEPDSHMESPDGYKVVLFYRSNGSQHAHYEFEYGRLINVEENSSISQSWKEGHTATDLDERPDLLLFRIKSNHWLIAHYIKVPSEVIVFEFRSEAAVSGIRQMGANQYSLNEVILNVDSKSSKFYLFTPESKFKRLEEFPYSVNDVINAFDDVEGNEAKEILFRVAEILNRLSFSNAEAQNP
jgi:hypothetical protein